MSEAEATSVASDTEISLPVPELRTWGELTLVIEVPKGKYRKVGDDGYEMYMHADYGFVTDTVSMEEGDGLDVFINPESPTESFGKVYTVGMMTETGVLEEEKVFLNFDSMADARRCFSDHYSQDKLGYCYVMSDADFTNLARMRQLEAKLKDGNPSSAGAESISEIEDPQGELTEISENPGLLSVNGEKSSHHIPLHRLAKGLGHQQLAKIVLARREIRNATKG